MKLEKLMPRWEAVPRVYVGMIAAIGLFLVMMGYVILS